MACRPEQEPQSRAVPADVATKAHRSIAGTLIELRSPTPDPASAGYPRAPGARRLDGRGLVRDSMNRVRCWPSLRYSPSLPPFLSCLGFLDRTIQCFSAPFRCMDRTPTWSYARHLRRPKWQLHDNYAQTLPAKQINNLCQQRRDGGGVPRTFSPSTTRWHAPPRHP